MISARDLTNLRTASPDYAETEALKTVFQTLRRERSPFFLTGPELDRVFHWKLRGQYGRGAVLRGRNSEDAYRSITEAVFKVAGPKFEYECSVRLRLLSALSGVAIPVASAVLALAEPERYCVIDFRGWRALFGEQREHFEVTHYLRYRSAVALLAAELHWPVQEADLAIWEYDRRYGLRPASPDHLSNEQQEHAFSRIDLSAVLHRLRERFGEDVPSKAEITAFLDPTMLDPGTAAAIISAVIGAWQYFFPDGELRRQKPACRHKKQGTNSECGAAFIHTQFKGKILTLVCQNGHVTKVRTK